MREQPKVMTAKQIIPNLNDVVRWRGTYYILRGGIVRRSDVTGAVFYQAELLDMKSHTLVIANPDEVEIVNEGE